MAGEAWIVRLGDAAAADFAAIVDWTAEQFGTDQARIYAASLTDAVTALRDGPAVPGVKRRAEIGATLCTLHVARNQRRGRHFVLFRVRGDERPPVIDVLRILHDAMDLARHLPESQN